jgi:arylsulfatase A-like enzyme
MKTASSPLSLLSFLALTAGCEADQGAASPANVPAPVAPAQGPAPNIVILTLDTTRADHLGSYGYFRDTTPRLDQLAAEALVFERCIAPTASTLPSHTTLLTGATPSEHGVLTNMSFGAQPRWALWGLRSFAQLALDAGYYTGAVVSAAPVKRGTGLELGFTDYDQPAGLERPAAETTDAALAWLEQRGEGPFLLWVHWFDPHQPLEAPDGFGDFGDDAPQRDAALARRGVPDQDWHLRTGGSLVTGALVDAYDAELRYMDAEVGRLLDALRASPGWDRTAVVVMGDHGEGVGQHGVLEHGELWWEQVHVPLIMRLPGGEPGRVPRLVGVADVLPTLVGRLQRPELSFGGATSGRDVLAAGAESRPQLVSVPGHEIEDEPYGCGLITRDYELMLPREGAGDVAPRLYALDSDPTQLRDVASEQPRTVASLTPLIREPCAAWHRAASELISAEQQTEAMRQLTEELRALGYVD